MEDYGMLMRPCAMNEEEHRRIWKTSEFWTEKNFLDEYSKHRVAMQHVAECAKIFIMENWQKINDWSRMNVVILCRQGRFEFYNYETYPHKSSDTPEEPSTESDTRKPRKVSSSGMDEFLKEMDEKLRAKHNPIKEVKEFVLDPSDGDFSVTINGQELWMINEEAVIEISNWMEEELRGPEEPKESLQQ